MPAKVTLKLDKRFQKRLVVLVKGYTAEVGVLENKPHYLPARKTGPAGGTKSNLKNLAGGPARKIGRRAAGTIAEVSEKLRKHTGINFYTKPFSLPRNKDILRFANEYVKTLLRPGSNKRRVENLLQAIVRNPILRGDYGRNRPVTARAKGFNRFMIDTGQLFNNIKARVTRRV